MVWYGMVWYGMVEVCEGAPVAVSGWVLTDRHDLAPCAANSLHRGTISVSNMIGAYMGKPPFWEGVGIFLPISE